MEKSVAVIQGARTPVMIRREMAKLPEIINSLEPIERAVFLASTAKTIAEFTSSELAAELATTLKWICKDVGYRVQDESDRQYLIIRTAEILKRYYGNLSLNDFRMAFEMSITGELDEFLPKGRDGQADRGHYQQFNAEYICKVLNAYKARRAWVLKKANDIVPHDAQRRNPDVEKMYEREMKRELVLAYEAFKNSGKMPPITAIEEMLYYKVLAAVGLAPEIEVTKEEQKQILLRTIFDMMANGFVADAKRLENAGTDAPELQHGAFVLARRKALENAFSDMVLKGVELTDYVEI